ncbi:MAG: hypothetical protein ACYS30_09090 [Planctomycetota bacterium]|jgi:hypothetical protein
MKSEEVYNAWKERKSQIEISENFTDEVMNQVYQHAQKKRKSMFDMRQLVELISAHPLAKAGLVAAGAVAGFVRVAFVVCMFLGS